MHCALLGAAEAVAAAAAGRFTSTPINLIGGYRFDSAQELGRGLITTIIETELKGDDAQ
ncbi:MAG: hypothetical protein WAK55_09985 [Xanthobacteraceae bacterium]